MSSSLVIQKKGDYNMVTYEDVVNNPEVQEFIKNAQKQLDVLGYTEHSVRHCALVAERAAYVSEKPQRILFGIGTVQEKDFPTVFKIGYEKNRDRPNQIDTGDNAWAPLMLRMGFLGIGVYLTTIFLPFIMFFYRHRKNVMSYCLLLYILVSLFIISFTYSEIAFSGFWFMPIILIAPLLTGFERKRTLYASRNVI